MALAAQLLHATTGITRVATHSAFFIVPPGAGLWIPAHSKHASRMRKGLAIHGLFLREDSARAGSDAVAAITISPLLRALILASCEQPVMWNEGGPMLYIVALILHEIEHAVIRPVLPVSREARLRRVTEAHFADPADSRGLDAFAELAGPRRTLAGLFRCETGMGFRPRGNPG